MSPTTIREVFGGTPNEVQLEHEIEPGVWSDLGALYAIRDTIAFDAPATRKPKTLQYTAVDYGVGLELSSLQRVRAKFLGRYQLVGAIQVLPMNDAGSNQYYDIKVTDDFVLLFNGSKAIEEPITIPPGQTDYVVIRGGTFVLPSYSVSTEYLVGDYTQPSTPNTCFYRRAVAEIEKWAPNTAYPLKTFRRPTSADGKVLKVVAVAGAGKSGPVEPNWSTLTALGQMLTDGDLTWRYDANEGQSGMVEPTWSTTVGAIIADGGLLWECKGSTAWGGLLPLFCPEIRPDGVNTLATLGEFTWKAMSPGEALEEIRQWVVANTSVNWDFFVSCDTLGRSVLQTVDWNNPIFVPPAQKEVSDIGPFSTTVIEWKSFQRTRQGTVVNQQTAWGPNNAKGEIDGSVAPPKAWTPNMSTNRLESTAHGFTNGTVVFLSNSGSPQNLPNPLRERQDNGLPQPYYVAGATANTFYLTYTPGGNQITFKSSGSGGTHYVVDARYDQYARQSYLLFGTRRGKQIELNEPQYEDSELLRELARGKVRRDYLERDTIELALNDIIHPDVLQTPVMLYITNTAPGQGLSRVLYPVGHTRLTFPNGIALWQHTAGDRLETEAESNEGGLRYGQLAPGDTASPGNVREFKHTSNTYDPASDRSYADFLWVLPPDRDYKRTRLKWWVPGTAYSAEAEVGKPGVTFRLAMYPGRDYIIQTATEDLRGNSLGYGPEYPLHAAERLLSNTYNPNFIAPNLIKDEVVPEGWFKELGVGSTIKHTPGVVVLTAPTNTGARIKSGKQRVRGGDPHYEYRVEIQATSDISSRLEVLVDFYDSSDALLSTTTAVPSQTVGSALLTRVVPLTIPATAVSLAIRPGIPAGVTTQPLSLRRVEVIEQYRVQPPVLAPDTTAFGSYRYVRPGGEFGVALTPPSDGPAPEGYAIQFYPASANPDNPFFAALIRTKDVPTSQAGSVTILKQVLDGLDIDVPMKARVRSKWRGSLSDWSAVLDFEVPSPQAPAAPSPITLIAYGQNAASTEMTFAPDPDTPEPVEWMVWAYKEGDPSQSYKEIIPGTARVFQFPEVVEVDVNYKYKVLALVVAITGTLIGVSGAEATFKAPLPTAAQNLRIDTTVNSPYGYVPDGVNTMSLGAIWSMASGARPPATWLLKAVPGQVNPILPMTSYPGQITATTTGKDLDGLLALMRTGQRYSIAVFGTSGGKYSAQSNILDWTVPTEPPGQGGPANPGFDVPGAAANKADKWMHPPVVSGVFSERRTDAPQSGDGYLYLSRNNSPTDPTGIAPFTMSMPFAIHPGERVSLRTVSKVLASSAPADSILWTQLYKYPAGTQVGFGAELVAVTDGAGHATSIDIRSQGEGYPIASNLELLWQVQVADPTFFVDPFEGIRYTVPTVTITVTNGRITNVAVVSGGVNIGQAWLWLIPKNAVLDWNSPLSIPNDGQWHADERASQVFGPNEGKAFLIVYEGRNGNRLALDSLQWRNISTTGFNQELPTANKSTLVAALTETYQRASSYAEPLTFNGELLFFNGDVLMIGKNY
jgi:hypothetical protein